MLVMLTRMIAITIPLVIGTPTTSMAEAGSENTIQGEITIIKRNEKEKKYRSNVVIFLDQVESDTPFIAPPENPKVSQRARRFRPRTLPVLKNTSVDFPNDDRVMHNVYSLSKIKPFDLGVYKKGETKTITFDKPGIAKVYCNIHSNMVMNVLVLNNPFFTSTDSHGQFKLAGIPNGSYLLRIWHEYGDEISKEITLSGGEIQEHLFTLQETTTFIQHKNKYGNPYGDKY